MNKLDIAHDPMPPNVITPVQLLSIAVEKGADIEKLEQLFELQERWEKSEARKAYHLAVSKFKTESIEITKNKTVAFTSAKGTTKYNHATLDHILEMVTPALGKHGLSHSWVPVQGDGGRITVTCILTHSLGHSESVELSGSPDDTGNKNNIQRVGSTITYLQRYTFLSITGLAAKDQDDDGVASGTRKQENTSSITTEKVDYGKVNAAVAYFKKIINKDNIENYTKVIDAWSRLNNNEKCEVEKRLKDKAPGANKMYKSILREYIAYVPEVE